MSKLRISAELTLPEDVVTSTLVVYGGKGMGKTNLGSVLVEELTRARLRWCVLDPMGVWWGLRHSADGKGPGVECIVLGGAHGDIPIEPTGGAIVADLVIDEDVNTIIDFSRRPDGKMWTVGERVRFVTDYTVRLFARQGELVGGRRREPLMQIIDEAARYIPQTIPSGAIDLAKCVGAWEQVCEEGRNIGLGVTFLTQRSARMNKSVSELADVMFAFRTVGPNSLAAVMDWLGEHVDKSRMRDLAAQVRELNVGQALVVSPGWLKTEKVAQIRHRDTFDSSATPKPGERGKRVTGNAAKPDLAKYQTRMAEQIERAKADDPKALRAQIVALARELAAAKKATPAAPAPKRVEVPVLPAKTAEILAKAAARLADDAALVSAASKDVLAALARVQAVVPLDSRTAHLVRTPERRGAVWCQPPEPHHTVGPREDRERIIPVRKVGGRLEVVPSANGERKLDRCARAMLQVLAQRPVTSATQLAVLTGYSLKSSSFGNAIGALRSMGLASGGGDGIRITPAGRDAAGPVEPLPSGRALIDHWLGKLDKAEKAMLSALIAAGPDGLATKEDLAARAGYSVTSSSFGNAIGKLRTLELAEGYGPIRACATLLEAA